ncbi:nickel pincer cofactor biosynthesis protein LarB [Pseudovibrio sp. Tun.PSC04-5.I4]|uniref:nickel pincer cofactor biosynthesis protein LarB n=1 Tax=Pseudovibrio sp. Tun.PSC04-5.I4 TaxID=1798213 RepID=UPI00088123D6|nr:nickel pincer cofactor biosynthesis protein LarB [Pseudovibrio sp. Tun.PSC04-5.I4]SDR48836.1 hypothetical protein SAMN04515695_6069 [Pseudovibrio sp. Tun.PSC04-5.I4]
MEVQLDLLRRVRTGLEEAIFCEGKSPDQINGICETANSSGYRLLLTRLTSEKFSSLSEAARTLIDYDVVSNTAILGEKTLSPAAHVAVVSGGTSDVPVCKEVVRTLNYHGFGCDEFYDLGVTGLWRLMDRLPDLRKYKVIIAAAGMEAALPTVLGGLIKAPVIALPTSIGYGVAQGGKVALQSCLASCSGSLLTVNIDNGFGAACAAIKILQISEPQNNPSQ